MAVAQGFSKITTSGSVFMYDTADTVNSYKGEPSTNLALFSMNGSFSSDYPSNITFTDDSTVTYQGRQSKRVVATGQWNIYRYPRPGNYTATSSGQFTYSFKIKWADGHTPYFSNGYIYVDASTTYPGITVRAIDNGWFWCYCTYSGTSSPPWLTGFTTTDTGTCWITDWQLEAGLLHPTQYIAPGGTRSATEGLVPLVNNSIINLSSVSFDSNAQIVFDGTDDRMYTSETFNLSNNFTFDFIIKPNTLYDYGDPLGASPSGDGDYGMTFVTYSNGSMAFNLGNGSSWSGGEISTSAGYLTNGTYYHIVGVCDGGTLRLYKNGIQTHTGSTPYAFTNYSINIGNRARGYAFYPFNGYVATVKAYNRALTPGEILNNYNHYKTKYNLT